MLAITVHLSSLSAASILKALSQIEHPGQFIGYQRRPGGENSRPYIQLELVVGGQTRLVRVYLRTGACRLVREGGADIAHLDPARIAEVLKGKGCNHY